MTRRGSRAEGRTIDTERPAASYTTTEPPRDAALLHCACGATWRDYPDSYTAHRKVFGHRPIRKPAPAQAESAPEQHQEGAGWTG